MTVQAILNVKGSDVVSVLPGERIAGAVRLMMTHGIGAVLVRDEIGVVVGILSERDVMRALAREGAACLDASVASLATRDVICCQPEDGIGHVMGLMTRGRFRHLPVMRDGTLAGLVSIGDIVKHRLAEVETEARSLREYVATG
ncbi:CBS domain protein [Stella humosa]|uniref:CBS domain protein n=1 Tax=Stella humosa TaxID=94 RepID=A0A3N1M7R5_9PROT|nr:CBS domain-containing protein [Stella humosa]ROP99762.1 CBS domain protein [Stella humosa]BBK31011.1 inosine-5-monophosphate dehydrogenase [Stella humosa]